MVYKNELGLVIQAIHGPLQQRFARCLCTYHLFLRFRFGSFDLHFIIDLSSQITGISWTILHGGCSGKHQNSDISNSFAMWTLWYGGFYSLIKCFKWFCSFTAGRYFSRILVVLLCLVGRVNLVSRKSSQHNILIYTFLWRKNLFFHF